MEATRNQRLTLSEMRAVAIIVAVQLEVLTARKSGNSDQFRVSHTTRKVLAGKL